jgi:hypothetical protein
VIAIEEIDQADLDEPAESEAQDDLDTVLHVAALKKRPGRTPPRVMTEAQQRGAGRRGGGAAAGSRAAPDAGRL